MLSLLSSSSTLTTIEHTSIVALDMRPQPVSCHDRLADDRFQQQPFSIAELSSGGIKFFLVTKQTGIDDGQ